METKIDELVKHSGKANINILMYNIKIVLWFSLLIYAFMSMIAKSKAEEAQVQATAEFVEITKEQQIINEYVLKHCPRNWRWYCDKETGFCQKGCR